MRKAKYDKYDNCNKIDVELSGTFLRTILIGTPPIELTKKSGIRNMTTAQSLAYSIHPDISKNPLIHPLYFHKCNKTYWHTPN